MATHECPCGCGKKIEFHLLACRSGWYRLPRDIRNAVNAGWPGDSPRAHGEAVAQAVKWYAEHPPRGRKRPPPVVDKPEPDRLF